METRRFKADTYAFYHATSCSKRMVADILREASDVMNDPRREERMKKHECKACFYVRGRCGGSA